MDEPRERAGRRFPSASMITAIAAGIIGISALGVSLYEAYLMRLESRVAVLPILESWSFYGSEGFGVNVANKGIGPAMIRSVQVFRDSAATRTWAEVYGDMVDGDLPSFSLAMITGNVMMPGEVVPAIQVERSEAARQLWINSERVSMKICYCSIYEECWVQSLDNVRAGVPRTEPTARCEVDEDSRF